MRDRLIFAASVAVLACATACGDDRGSGSDGGGSDTDTDGDTDADSDAGADSGPTGPGTLVGTVWSPTGFPIAGALVYVTSGDAEEIPEENYCYECDDMTGNPWTLSGPDGAWTIEGVEPGPIHIVTRKGFFRRQRSVEVVPGEVKEVAAELTTLPSHSDYDGFDRIPNIAVLLASYDTIEDVIAKFGLGDLTDEGRIEPGSEEFMAFDDTSSVLWPALSPSSVLFTSQEMMNNFHMILFPDPCDALLAEGREAMLQAYVASGGSILATGWGSQWVEQPYPDVMELAGDDDIAHAGDVGEWDSLGSIEDAQMRDWLAAVAPSSDPDALPFDGGYTLIDSLTSGVYPGHGAEEDGYLVIPRVWATDVSENPDHPLATTFAYDCGKVAYTTYPGAIFDPSPDMRPQEWVTIYMILELPGGGPCE